ncbi:MAG: hypothetical protein QOK48_563 [Blastocatellia bacterium]|jgi:hypothetical protein|nr:hypothetical protein [Blastocatellia bacterium]
MTIMSDQSVAQHYLDDALHTFRDQKKLAERAFAQITDADFFAALDAESNSIAVNVKHMAGNMISRWTDFLTTDGEKPNRDRDMEFVILPEAGRADLLAFWEKGWRCVFDAIEPLGPDDLMRTVLIRGQEHTVLQAINRQIAHYSYHTGQIVFLAKHFKSSNWQSLSVPRNRSAEFNAHLEQKMKESAAAPRADRLDEVMDFASKRSRP